MKLKLVIVALFVMASPVLSQVIGPPVIGSPPDLTWCPGALDHCYRELLSCRDSGGGPAGEDPVVIEVPEPEIEEGLHRLLATVAENHWDDPGGFGEKVLDGASTIAPRVMYELVEQAGGGVLISLEVVEREIRRRELERLGLAVVRKVQNGNGTFSCYAQAPSTTLSYLPLTLHLRFLQPYLDFDLCDYAVGDTLVPLQAATPMEEAWLQLLLK